jgi:Spy/CpxP family protein refolding chaperone
MLGSGGFILMTKWILTAAAVLAASAGTVALHAQPPGGMGGLHGGPRGEKILALLATHLDLTEAQKTQAGAIFTSARTQSEPVVTQLKQQRETVASAVKAGKTETEVRQLAAAAGPLAGQLAASHAAAMLKFYQILTVPQREKLEKLHEQLSSWFGSH